MKVGIIGLPQTGKKTLHQILTGTKHSEHTDIHKLLIGTADIQDSRFDILVNMYSPKKVMRARVDIALLPKMEKETIAKGDIFKDIVDMDAICHVVRAFEDEAVYHVDGSVGPVRDIEMVNSELILHDLLFVEKRIERIELSLRKLKDKKQETELLLMQKMRTHLENEKPLRLMDIEDKEKPLISSYPFITLKQLILAINVSDDNIGNNELVSSLEKTCEENLIEIMQISAKVEAEIAALDSEEEKKEFLDDLGIKDPALETLTRLCLKVLGLIPFFTVGADEVREWLVKKGSPAPEAAGVIHSDLQKGFIRAEVMKYDELIEHKDEAGLKKAGKAYLKGKDYIVENGDILNIRFNV